MRKPLIVLFALALTALALAPASATQGAEQSTNLKVLGQVEYDGGTELATDGRWLYTGEMDGAAEYPSRGAKPEEGGVHIVDISGAAPKEVGFFKCPGNDNDVEVVKPGLVVVGHHVAVCNPAESGSANHGVYLLDVKDPKRPKIVGSVNLPSGMSSHTIRVYPGGKYIYVNPGGLPSNGRLTTHIIDVSNPKKPVIAATYQPQPLPTGCHDFSFWFGKGKKLGFCAGYGGFAVWDVSDPVAPQIIGRVPNPQIEFAHYAVASSDGKILAIDDEAAFGHTCREPKTFGRVWFYDISNPASPTLLSSFAPPRGGDAAGIGHFAGWIPSWCLSHGLDWQPGTKNVAVTWFSGGMSVLSLDDPASPEEIAFFQPEQAATYSALWVGKKLFTNDTRYGLHGYSIKGL